MTSPPTDSQAEFFWETNNDGGFSEARKQSLPVKIDGRWHVYSFNVGSNPAWSGLISQLRLDPVQSGGAGDYVDIAWISYQNAFSSLLPATDFNGDGKTDYVLENVSTLQTALWYLNNNTFLGGAYGPTIPAGWSLVDVADFNGGGKPDYALFNPTTRQTAIWYMNNNALIGGAYGPTLPSGWSLVATGDFNNDSKPDYVLYNATTRQTAIWYMNNNALFGGAYGPTLPAGWSLVAP
jgi:hypothetical protein